MRIARGTRPKHHLRIGIEARDTLCPLKIGFRVKEHAVEAVGYESMALGEGGASAVLVRQTTGGGGGRAQDQDLRSPGDEWRTYPVPTVVHWMASGVDGVSGGALAARRRVMRRLAAGTPKDVSRTCDVMGVGSVMGVAGDDVVVKWR